MPALRLSGARAPERLPQECVPDSNFAQAARPRRSHVPVSGGERRHGSRRCRKKDGDNVMKKFLMSAAVLTVLASPALAQSYDPNDGTGNTTAQAEAGREYGAPTGSYAYARTLRGLRAQAEPDVAAHGRDVGTELKRAWGARD
jgi:hypothetical protein